MAYVRFALANRAKSDLTWRGALRDEDDPDYTAAAIRAFMVLGQAIRRATAGSEPSEASTAPSIAAWSMVHGLARLALDGIFGSEEGSPECAVERMLPLMLDPLEG